ncbi:MAG TPA: hypothetical protein VFF68_10905, partial [Anaerolineaceae bacterium]|nr:hypothetical protein [Anaerolineaceae bacterium]
MNLPLRLLPRRLPAWIRKAILIELTRATARAFKSPAPKLSGLSYGECLQAYARFTSDQAEIALQSGQDLAAIKTQLRQNAYPLGERLHRCFGADTMEEVIKLGQILYQAISVEIEGDRQGSVTVRRCYFSQYYAAPVCDLISALDDGVF